MLHKTSTFEPERVRRVPSLPARASARLCDQCVVWSRLEMVAIYNTMLQNSHLHRREVRAARREAELALTLCALSCGVAHASCRRSPIWHRPSLLSGVARRPNATFILAG